MPAAPRRGVLVRYGPLLDGVALGLAGGVVGDAGIVGVPVGVGLGAGADDVGWAGAGAGAVAVAVGRGALRRACWVAGPVAPAAPPAEGAGRTNT